MEQRLSLVTLGVENIERARAFYAALGWKESLPGNPDVAFFQLSGTVLSLYRTKDLLKDMGREGALPVPGGMSMGINVRAKEEVAALCEAFVSSGGTLLRAPFDTPWGSHTAYAADPEGNPWEFSYLPMFPLQENGDLILPESM